MMAQLLEPLGARWRREAPLNGLALRAELAAMLVIRWDLHLGFGAA
jgi:hypothetical protein